ncbi:Cation/H(+) antiporter like [Quillaja saponaria]|uniref:Cation/H(+) antiporter like n=1 Tax=Quillaja saponaria TaxID=32244 RepID=A0AAD7LK17_QUISA|nr:Cation/H(+) antiporter like [Quillaja saponaria]
MDVGMPFRTAKTAWRIGFMSFISSFLVMGLLLYSFYNSLPGFGKEQLFVLFFPAFSCFCNFPVIAQALDELNLLTSDLGHLSMPCAMLNDAIQWCVIGIGVFFRQWKTLESVGAFFSFLGFLSFNIVVIRPAMIWIKKTTPDGKPVKETYIVLILVGVLVMVAAFDAVGVPYVHGPLILGLTIPDGPPLGATLEEKSELIISEFFLPLFFLVVGANTDIHIRPRDALLLSLVMNVEGIVELVTYSRWKTQKLINEQHYTQMILTTVAVTGIVTPLIEIFYKPETVLISSKRQNEQMRTIQTTPHNSELRILVCIRNEENLHGGRDDREGLALASRMSGNPDVTVTLLRIMARLNKKTGDSNGDSFEEHEETERMLDENLLVEFKAKNASNACVVCREISVNDTVDGFQALTTLESNYDLVIVGKRHGIISFVDENTFDFVEFEELGVVGDIFLASKDFCKGVASVLVMQQFGNQLKAVDGFGSSNSKDWGKGCNERRAVRLAGGFGCCSYLLHVFSPFPAREPCACRKQQGRSSSMAKFGVPSGCGEGLAELPCVGVW